MRPSRSPSPETVGSPSRERDSPHRFAALVEDPARDRSLRIGFGDGFLVCRSEVHRPLHGSGIWNGVAGGGDRFDDSPRTRFRQEVDFVGDDAIDNGQGEPYLPARELHLGHLAHHPETLHPQELTAGEDHHVGSAGQSRRGQKRSDREGAHAPAALPSAPADGEGSMRAGRGQPTRPRR